MHTGDWQFIITAPTPPFPALTFEASSMEGFRRAIAALKKCRLKFPIMYQIVVADDDVMDKLMIVSTPENHDFKRPRRCTV